MDSEFDAIVHELVDKQVSEELAKMFSEKDIEELQRTKKELVKSQIQLHDS